MDFLQLNYYLCSDEDVQRSVYVRVYKLVEDEDKKNRILEVLNVPFFVDEVRMKNLFKNEDVLIRFTNSRFTDTLKSKTALVEFPSKKDLKTELRLIKYADDEGEKLFLFKNKNDFKDMTLKNCGKSLISKRFPKYIDDIDETHERVMEIMNNYNDEILVAQKKKKRRFEREDDGWVKVVRK